MLCRSLNRLFDTRMVRRLISTPSAEHQTNLDGYANRHRVEGTAFLEPFGANGEVKGKEVLDLGCGLGTRAIAIADAGAATIVGVDNDVEKIHRARRLAERLDLRSVAFSVQNGMELGFDAGRFDVVLMLDVIEHLRCPGEVLNECARVLRRGGRLLINFPPYRSPWGGHLFTHVPIPWAQLLFPDREVLDVWREVHARAVARGKVRCSAKRARAIIDAESTAELWDCNGMTIGRFLDLIDEVSPDLEEIRFKTLGNLGGLVKESPRLREHLVTRVAAVLAV